MILMTPSLCMRNRERCQRNSCLCVCVCGGGGGSCCSSGPPWSGDGTRRRMPSARAASSLRGYTLIERESRLGWRGPLRRLCSLFLSLSSKHGGNAGSGICHSGTRIRILLHSHFVFASVSPRSVLLCWKIQGGEGSANLRLIQQRYSSATLHTFRVRVERTG